VLGTSKLGDGSVSHLLLSEVLRWGSRDQLSLVVTFPHVLASIETFGFLRESSCHLGVHTLYSFDHLRLVKLLFLLFNCCKVSRDLRVLRSLSTGHTGHVIDISLRQVLRERVLQRQCLVEVGNLLLSSVILLTIFMGVVSRRLAHITSIHVPLSRVLKYRIIL